MKNQTYLSAALMLLLFFVCISPCRAQKRPQYSQYLFNSYLLNPAIAGIEPYSDLRMGYRNQWSGLEGAPETFYASIHAPFTFSIKNIRPNPVKPVRNSINPGRSAFENHHGLGAMIFSDKIGPFDRSEINFSYAYHMALTSQFKLSMGTSLGISQLRIDPDKINLADQNDLALSDENLVNLRPNLALGTWLYSQDFYFGLSIDQVLANQFAFGDYAVSTDRHHFHYFATAGLRIGLTEGIYLVPSTLVKWLAPAGPVLDINTSFQFYQRVNAGFSWRNTRDVILMTRFAVTPLLDIGYSYDYGQSDLSLYSAGSHEIFIGFRLNNKYRLYCPSQLW